MMKKLLLLIGLILIVVGLNAQSYINPSFYDFTAADTMLIKYSDNVSAVSVVVPESATDSVILYGAAKIIDGEVAGGIKIAPGLFFNYGYDGAIINYLYIVIKDKAQVVTSSPVRRP